MKLLSWTFGSRWFWAGSLIAATVAAVEVDRRGLAPWNRPEIEAAVLETPTVDLGTVGDPGELSPVGSLDDVDPEAIDFAADVTTGFESPSDRDATFEGRTEVIVDETDSPIGDIASTGNDGLRSGTSGDGFDFDAFARKPVDAKPAMEAPAERRLVDPFPQEPARTEELADRDSGIVPTSNDSSDGRPAADHIAGSPVELGDEVADEGFGPRERFELKEQLERLKRLDEGAGFDPLASPPGETLENDRRPVPLDPTTAYELPLERVGGPSQNVTSKPPNRTRAEKPAREVAPPAEVAVLEIELDVTAPLRMTAGGTAKFEVVVRNPGETPLSDVVLIAQLDDGFTLPGRAVKGARKQFGTLAGGETRKVGLSVVATSVDRAATGGRSCIHFEVTAQDLDPVQKRICVEVREPVVRLEMNGPQRRRVGERGEFTVKVVNDSEGPLDDVRLTIEHPSGLVARAASRGAVREPGRLVWALDRVAAGESVELQMAFDGTQAGQACLSASLEARDAVRESARFCVVVE